MATERFPDPLLASWEAIRDMADLAIRQAAGDGLPPSEIVPLSEVVILLATTIKRMAVMLEAHEEAIRKLTVSRGYIAVLEDDGET